MKTTQQITVGRLLCSTVRNFLRRAEIEAGITWKEGEGFFSRPFWITGDNAEYVADVIINTMTTK
jgi:hypothetical protein